jgi:hypothetical protein
MAGSTSGNSGDSSRENNAGAPWRFSDDGDRMVLETIGISAVMPVLGLMTTENVAAARGGALDFAA